MWKSVVSGAGGSAEWFQRRLEWDGISPAKADLFLTDEWESSGGKDDCWQRFLEHFTLENSEEGTSFWDTIVTETIGVCKAPFASAYRPFLRAALEIYHPGGPGPASEWIAPSVLPEALSGLLQELCKITAPALMRLFQDYLSRRGALPDLMRSTHYEAFTAELGRGQGWPEFLTGYAGLARLISILCVGWADELREFFTRLEADRTEFPGLFLPLGESAGSPLILTSLQAGISDRHHGAGTVKLLEFSTGQKLVYKRRPLDVERDFHDLLRELKGQGLDSAPPALRVLAKNGYGWVEYAAAGPLNSKECLEKWFRSAGSLLCLMHLLGGNDGHMENVIATVSGPVLIDLETLLQPGPWQSGNRAVEGTFLQAARRVQESVMQTGLLPLWQRGRQGLLYDIGGLTGEGGYESPAPRPVWESVGTDGICPAWRRRITCGLNNLPTLNGVRHSAGLHLPALCAGFAETWRFLQTHSVLIRTALLKWSDAPLRVLVRPTTQYATLLERSLAVDVLQFGIDRSLVLETLRRPFVQNHMVRPLMWPTVEHEIQALEDGDIPVFYVRANGQDLLDVQGRCVVEKAYTRSALESALARIEALTDDSLQRQLEMIGSAFIRVGGGGAGDVPPVEAARVPIDYAELLRCTALISSEGLTKTAGVLGQQIIDAAIRGRDGFVTWMSPAFLQPDQRAQRGVSYYLYDGAAGIALFLAALARVTNSDPAKKTALAALEPVRAILDAPNAAQMTSREGIGGCSGLGSLVYSFTVISRLLDAPDLLERAKQVCLLIDESRIAGDQSLDIVSGCAGAIMGLLALHRATGDLEVLRRAVLCGNHLLSKAERVGDDALAWPSWPDRLLLAGYSHGTAGNAAALRALFQASGENDFAQAARAALRYERGLFDAKAENWPILLPGGASRSATTWCHGAPGILLSRAGFLGQFGEAEDALLTAEIEAARRATLAAGLSAVDHLCCGTMGRVAVLQDTAVAGKTAQNMEQLAQLGATLTIRRAQQRKAFALQSDPVRNSAFQPGFFRGSSGIGYTLLRLARPDLLPSVFNWEG